MNSDDFEKRLEQQTVRPVPSEWRREILQQAKSVSPSQLKIQPSKLRTALAELCWPCPQAWAGLAAVWVVILALSYSSNGQKLKMAKTLPPSPEYLMALKEQHRLYLELAGLDVKEATEPPKPITPGPRSELEGNFKIV